MTLPVANGETMGMKGDWIGAAVFVAVAAVVGGAREGEVAVG